MSDVELNALLDAGALDAARNEAEVLAWAKQVEAHEDVAPRGWDHV